MFRTLHARLTLALLALLLVVGAASLASILVTTRVHTAEASQSLNRDLANNIAAMKRDLLTDAQGTPRTEGLDELFHWLMVVNPDLELYLLDADGTILAFDAPPGSVVRERVDLAPVHAFLGRNEALPIVGDDPRHPSRRKVFSATPLPAMGTPRGYLYVVLASEQLEGAFDHLRSSLVLRVTAWTLAGLLLLSLLFGTFVFHRLTRPLQRLDARVRQFAHDHAPLETGQNTTFNTAPLATEAMDEVARLEATFDELTTRIQHQMTEIERLAGLRRELIANVSHDLRTPIATLMGYLETLQLKGEELSAQQRQGYVDTALRQSRRLGERVGELFELTKLQQHAITVNKETFSLAELIHDNLQRFRLQATRRGVTLHVDIDAERPYTEGDIGLVERVLENLIVNAIRYTPPDGTVTVTLRQHDGQLTVGVRDTGCGIDEAELPHIFDRYYQGGEGRETGAGLGLAITQKILHLHDSQIEVASQAGKGTTFSFALAATSH